MATNYNDWQHQLMFGSDANVDVNIVSDSVSSSTQWFVPHPRPLAPRPDISESYCDFLNGLSADEVQFFENVETLFQKRINGDVTNQQVKDQLFNWEANQALNIEHVRRVFIKTTAKRLTDDHVWMNKIERERDFIDQLMETVKSCAMKQHVDLATFNMQASFVYVTATHTEHLTTKRADQLICSVAQRAHYHSAEKLLRACHSGVYSLSL
jgi:hypothetical protein